MFGTENGRTVAIVQYRDFTGRKRPVKRAADSKVVAGRRVLAAVDEALRRESGAVFTSSATFGSGIDGWLAYFEGLVERGARSLATLNQYRDTVRRHVRPGLGGLRLGKLTTPRVDRFLQSALADKGYTTAKICRTVLSGVCWWLVRQGGLTANPVREVTPLEAGSAKVARARDASQISGWLAVVDASAYARRWDLPDLMRLMLGAGLRIGEALGVCWSDVDLDLGVLHVERTVIRVRGKGLQAKARKTRSSVRVLVLSDPCVRLVAGRSSRITAVGSGTGTTWPVPIARCAQGRGTNGHAAHLPEDGGDAP